jgi:hypothetical protein
MRISMPLVAALINIVLFGLSCPGDTTRQNESKDGSTMIVEGGTRYPCDTLIHSKASAPFS